MGLAGALYDVCGGDCACADAGAFILPPDDEKAGAVESGVRFFDNASCHHRPDIYGGIQAAAAEQLLTAFFAVDAPPDLA